MTSAGADGLGGNAEPTAEGLRTESFTHGAFTVELTLPASSESLIDEDEFEKDERLPYWAELWPSARALARELLEAPSVPARALELGCGVGLPSLVLSHRGVDVVASDYYEHALEFTRQNATRNGLAAFRTQLLDWRSPPVPVETYPLVVAADVLYEGRNADALVELLPLIVEPGGRFLIADPGRVYLGKFISSMQGLGWAVASFPDRMEEADGGRGLQTRVQLFAISRETEG